MRGGPKSGAGQCRRDADGCRGVRHRVRGGRVAPKPAGPGWIRPDDTLCSYPAGAGFLLRECKKYKAAEKAGKITERINGMFVVMDYGDKIGPDFTSAHVKTANYRQEDSIFMGPWKPLVKRRGFPEEKGRNVLDLLYDKIKTAGEKVDYVCLGQMTTPGCLMFTHPDVTEDMARTLICPGEHNKDRDYPVSAEHILPDPVAARLVMNAVVKKTFMAENTLHVLY